MEKGELMPTLEDHAEARSGEEPAVAVRAHLLLVDDDPHILKLCQWYLKAAAPLAPDGVETEIHTAATSDAALAAAEAVAERNERIAVALVDVVLPGGTDGIDTIRMLWERDAEIQCTLVTGAGERIERELQERLPGAFLDRWDYLSKPFTEFEIVQRVRRSLSSWCTHQRDARRAEENRRLMLQLARNNQELEVTVQERTRALADRNEEQERKNRELEQALRDLEAAQSRLLQQEKMACIGLLAAGVAHELNNPIGFVHSNLGTLRKYCEKLQTLLAAHDVRLPSDDAELNELRAKLKIDFVMEDLPALIEESQEGTERVRKIVSDLKVFSHPAEHEPKHADLNEGLQSTLNIVHNEIKYKARVLTDFGEIPPVRCLPGQINQVLMNLLVNAAHAIETEGQLRLCTTLDGDSVVITVADTGCGISEANLSRIFDPFFTTKEVGKGTGLGLSISYDIVRRHGGTMNVQSRVGEGTTFTIRLPVEGNGGVDGGG